MKSNLPEKLTPFIFYFLKPYRWHLFGVALSMTYSALHLSIEPYILKLLMDSVTEYSGDPSQLIKDHLVYVAIFLGQGVFLVSMWRLKDSLFLKMVPSLKANLVESLFDEVIGHSYRFYQEHLAGSIVNRIKELSQGIEELLESTREVFRQVLVVLIATLMMGMVHPYFALILFGWAVLFIGIGYIASHKILAFSTVFSEGRSETFGKMVDVIGNHSNVRLFSRKRYEKKFLSENLHQLVNQEGNLRSVLMTTWTLQGILASIMLGLMMMNLLILRRDGVVSIGDFAFVMWISVGLIDQIWMISDTIGKILKSWGVCSQALRTLSQPKEVLDIPGAKDIQIVSGKIEFQHVSFAHEIKKGGTLFFKDLNVTIEPGSKVGLVGYSGSGKTTFAHLIVRLFNTQSGRILIDSQDISHVTQHSLREKMSFIPQDPILFHRNIRENIRYGKLDATDAEVEEAAKKAHAHPFIQAAPDGYNSSVGDRGIKLSGGQRQRIAIARAILKNAPLLILDEATSALDSVTESHIQESLEELMKGKTTLIIAHRLSTLLTMDRILVFQDGEIKEDGSHETLLQNNGLYSVLWKSQFKHASNLIESEENDIE